MKIFTAQFNPHVGDIESNANRIIEIVKLAETNKADLIVFPELALCGYPPEDLLLRPSMQIRIDKALQSISNAVQSSVLIIGFPYSENGKTYNSAGIFENGELIARYDKRELPNYRVFDEKRYFDAGDSPCIFSVCGQDIGVTICEDLWHDAPIRETAQAGAQLIININASPFHTKKHAQRLEIIREQIKKYHIPILYANLVGGQDELVFDGDSMLLNAEGDICYQAKWFEQTNDVLSIDLSKKDLGLHASVTTTPDTLEATYQALVLAVRDYVEKNGFAQVVLGLSGGIDSALTLAITVDALGAERVRAIMMPYCYTSDLSQSLAAQQAETMEVDYRSISIENTFEQLEKSLTAEFDGREPDITEQNMQARIRGVILMAISNKQGSLVLTTGNKSEVAVGYSTLYGDMAGGFDVLKDVLKTKVYELAKWRNKVSQVIPEEVINRAPTAELAPDQVDQDSLPDYDELDAILEAYIELDMSLTDIVEKGFDPQTVERVIKLVDRNEYKRRQAAIGPRISQRAFGRDRRYPIVNGWKPGP